MSDQNPTTVEVGKYVKSLATHFTSQTKGWYYTRDIGDLKHIRYGSDSTGYNHWTKRVRRAFDWKHLTGRDPFSRMFRNKGVKRRLISAWAWIYVSLRKDNHRPDGVVGGAITHWEEDGEYIESMGPTIGVLVAEFLIAEPEHPHAIRIADEIRRIVWRDRTKEETGDEDS